MKRACLTLGIFCLPMLAGCSDAEDGIQAYTVAKEGDDAASKVKPRKHRLLGALVPEGNTMWFFKLTGLNGNVNAATKQFLKFIRTVDFKDGKPTWKVPEAWLQTADKGSAGMRFATIYVDRNDRDLVLTVIPLPRPVGDEAAEAKNVLDNVNRWRREVGLADRTTDNLYDTGMGEGDPVNTDEVRKLEINGRSAVITQFVGFPPKRRPGRGPFMSP